MSTQTLTATTVLNHNQTTARTTIGTTAPPPPHHLRSAFPCRRYLFLKRSDVYVVEPNLRHLTAQMDQNVPHLVGRMPKGREASKFMNPAHGIIISRALMDMLRPLAKK